ncbi:glycosyltransferase family A protein [uncultured Psychroserpens sp.]|uniref:glycosyltransferase family 2 protein n=1 Tax=uncultured Psychroserpens sp. TaxID=255436 RepID=UPI00260BF4C2|nr:glycosyltransferase family A protein [uncultured Psychroserpens sp.]
MSSNQNILVSVVVPCYNQAQYLDEALQSVLDQIYTNWECIIVNDDSPDHTEAIAKAWVEKDQRFSYLKQDNKGLSGARNFGISYAKGEYILPLDADDRIGVDYIDLAIKAFKEDAALKVVYSNAEKFGLENKTWNLRPFSLFNLAKSNVIFCSAVFKKEDWERVGGYDEHMRGGLEDWEFWIHILKFGGEVFKIDKVCFFYRIKENSMIKDIAVDDKMELYRYVSVKHADFFVNQLGSFKEFMSQGLKENDELKVLVNSKKNALRVLLKPVTRFFKF